MNMFHSLHTLWCNQMGTVWKLTLFNRLQLLNYRSHFNYENSYLSVFVSSTSYYLFRTCINVWFLSYRLEKKCPFSNCSDLIASQCIMEMYVSMYHWNVCIYISWKCMYLCIMEMYVSMYHGNVCIYLCIMEMYLSM